MPVVRARAASERGQVIVMFGLLLPVIFGMAAIVIAVGNWYTHGKNLQSKVDASAFAGGGVWGFPCGPDTDANIEGQARLYAGSHTDDLGALRTSAFNPQVGNVDGSQVHMILNGSGYYDDDSNAGQLDRTNPTGPICDSEVLDVKGTEDNSFPLASLIPLFPDIKRKARVEIHQVEGISGLLPISVRAPKPASAAAIFYDETPSANKRILAVKPFCEKPAPTGVPAGLGYWTTNDATDPACTGWARLDPALGNGIQERTGVVIALSVRPACNPSATPPITTNCFTSSGFTDVDSLCRQQAGRIVQCFYGTGTGATQTVNAGLQFIHGYSTAPPVTTGSPRVRGAWLTAGGCVGGYGSGYFAAPQGSCGAAITAQIDAGSCYRRTTGTPPVPTGGCVDPATATAVETRTAGNVEVKYTLVYGTGNNNDICDFGIGCDLARNGTGQISATGGVTLPATNAMYSVALRIRMKQTSGVPNCDSTTFSPQCEFYYTSNPAPYATEPLNSVIFPEPLQRSFMGDDDRSGPIKFLRLSADRGCNTTNGLPDYIDVEAASQPIGQPHCFSMEMGLKGALAKDQDEPPIVFNLKASQSATIDCDPNIPNTKGEVVAGCSPFFRANDFMRDPPCPSVTSWGQMQSPPAPYDVEWPPYTCALTQTGNPRQLLDGFLERFFNDSSNPACPSEGSTGLPQPEYVKGRNYWHDANNTFNIDPTTGLSAFTFAETVPTLVHGNNLRDDDPRLISLFMTGYDSFSSSGNELFPIVNFGSFYVTGLGTGRPGGGLTVEDPCADGNSDSSLGAGNKPPPDIKTESGGAYVWGHFIDNVVPSPRGTPSDQMCAPSVSFQPCVAVLVQ